MPANKNARARYRIIDRCLRDRRSKWTRERLAKACEDALSQMGLAENVSVRTIQEDINAMRYDPGLDYNAPIHYDRKLGYIYDNPDYSIHKTALNQYQLELLGDALTIMRHHFSDEQFQAIESSLGDLARAMNLSVWEGEEQVIHLESTPNKAAAQHLDRLRSAIKRRQCLTIQYWPFDFTQPYARTVSPYHLKQSNQRWYLLAWDHHVNDIQIYALDRIRKLQKSIADFVNNNEFNPETHFRDIVGTTVNSPGRVSKIIFEATPLQAKYIDSKPFHKSLKVLREEHEKVLFQLEVIPNIELEKIFLSFGEGVRVIEPVTFKQRLLNRLKKTIAQYD